MLNMFLPLGDARRSAASQEPALIAAARRGSRPAFDALLRAHESRLRGFLVRRVGPGAADDVLQETWIASWAALPHFAGRASFKAWLFGIAAHKCQDHYRRHAQEEAATAAVARDADRHVPPAWEAQIALRETVQTLLAQMPSVQREVLELYYYAELTLPEIASALGRNLNTVKYQFYRAHTLAAEGLAGEEGHQPRVTGEKR